MGAATQAFLTGKENKALMYMNEADKTLTGAAKMHLDAAINALQSGDSNMAKKHLGEIEYACGVPDIFWWETYMIRSIIFLRTVWYKVTAATCCAIQNLISLSMIDSNKISWIIA